MIELFALSDTAITAITGVIGTVLAALFTFFSAYNSYKLKRLEIQAAEAAKIKEQERLERQEDRDRQERIEERRRQEAIAAQQQRDRIETTALKTEKLCNSAMLAIQRQLAVVTRAKANQSKDPVDEAAADLAEHQYQAHEAAQKQDEATSIAVEMIKAQAPQVPPVIIAQQPVIIQEVRTRTEAAEDAVAKEDKEVKERLKPKEGPILGEKQ